MMIWRFAVLFFMCLGTSSCIVTDEIPFTDRVNHSPTVISSVPPNTIIKNVPRDELIEIAVNLWEPDEDDFSLYDGRIFLIENPYSQILSTQKGECDPPSTSDESAAQETTGVYITMNCHITPEGTNVSTDPFLIEIEISDRGYRTGDIPADDAQPVIRTWTYQLLPDGSVQ